MSGSPPRPQLCRHDLYPDRVRLHCDARQRPEALRGACGGHSACCTPRSSRRPRGLDDVAVLASPGSAGAGRGGSWGLPAVPTLDRSSTGHWFVGPPFGRLSLPRHPKQRLTGNQRSSFEEMPESTCKQRASCVSSISTRANLPKREVTSPNWAPCGPGSQAGAMPFQMARSREAESPYCRPSGRAETERGGHFAPFQEPELYPEELRAFFHSYRAAGLKVPPRSSGVSRPRRSGGRLRPLSARSSRVHPVQENNYGHFGFGSLTSRRRALTTA